MSEKGIKVGDWVRVKVVRWGCDDPKILKAKVLKVDDDGVGLGYDNEVVLMWAFVEDCEKIEDYE